MAERRSPLRAGALPVALATLAACLALPSGASAAYRYSATGPYLDYARRPPIIKIQHIGGAIRVKRRIGVQEWDGGAFRASAGDDAYEGLKQYSDWRPGHDRAHLRRALEAGRWTAQLQEPDGRFLYWFRFQVASDGRALFLNPPWYVSYTQGVALSLFTRLFRATGDRRWLRRARRALVPLTLPVAQGGMQADFLDSGLPWFEGYPTLPVQSHNLSHHVPALLGLYDMARYSPEARRLYRAGLFALIYGLPRYDEGGRVATWLLHETDPPRALIYMTAYAQEALVPELRALYSLSHDPTIGTYTARWNRELPRLCANPAADCLLH